MQHATCARASVARARESWTPRDPIIHRKASTDREGRMAKRQLSHIAEYAHDLSQMLEDETQLEAWVQSKLTKAADYIKTVKHYVEYGMEEGAYDQVMPGMQAEMPEMDPKVGIEAEIPLEITKPDSEEDDIYEY